jgi:hypothetical protein
VALALARGQRALGHDVTAISLQPGPDGPLAAELAAAGVATYTVPKRDGFDATLSLRLAMNFVRTHIHIVHTHHSQPLLYGAVAARLARARAVHTRDDAGANLLGQAAATLCDAYVAESDGTRELARRNREAAPDKLRTIAPGIDLARFHPDATARAEVRRELDILDAAFVFVVAGDAALVLRAAAWLLGDGRQLLIVGDARPVIASCSVQDRKRPPNDPHSVYIGAACLSRT